MRFFTFFLLLLSVCLYSQSDSLKSQYEAIYRVKMFPDTLSKNNEILEDLSLLISGNKSLFKSTKKTLRDSIAYAIGKKSFDNAIDGKVILDMKAVPSVNFKSEVYFENGQQTIYKELLKNRFAYRLEDIISWKIGSETKQIASYLCKKATGKYNGRNYTAWFTESVPIPDGPYTFKGLPGLILEVYDDNEYISFSIVSFKKIEKPIILMKDVANTKYSVFHRARQNFLDNPAGTFSNQTGFTVKPNDITRINNSIKRFNNYID